MSSDESTDASVEPRFVSTGRLPSPDVVKALVSEAHERFRSNRDGRVSDIYLALANVPQDQFGLCVVGVNGASYASGDWDAPFAINSAPSRRGSTKRATASRGNWLRAFFRSAWA